MTESPDPAFILTVCFALVLTASLLIRLWLAGRQIRYVAQHQDQVPAAFAERIALPAHRKAARYTIAKGRTALIEMALGAAVTLGWTLLGGLQALRGAVSPWFDGALAQQLALLVGFAVISGVIDLPLSWYQTFVVEQRFGFNQTTLRLWLSDLLKSVVVGTLIGLPLAAMFLWLMDSTGALWWLWAWLVWMGFQLLMLLIYPTVIAPLFNQFVPLEDEQLKQRVTALMERCGFKASGLYVMDGSRRSAHANAYFTGLGAAKRVVFFDTLLSKLSAAEVDAVLAHELGHFSRRHVVKRMALMWLLSWMAFALLGWLAAQSWFYVGLGVQPSLTGHNSATALILFLLVVPVFSFFISPLLAQLSRQHEFEADAFAVQRTNAVDLSNALLKLYEDNAATLTPDPLYVRFYYTHPPAVERMARMAQQP